MINDDAFQLQEDFMSFHKRKNKGNEGNENLTNIQQQLMQHFSADNHTNFESVIFDVQVRTSLSDNHNV